MKTNNVLGKIRIVVLILFFIFMFIPVYWIMFTSLKPVDEIVTMPVKYFSKFNAIKLF